MATWDISAGTQFGSNPSTVQNNRGVVKSAGSTGDNVLVNTNNGHGIQNTVIGSVVASGNNNQAIDGGTFATMTEGSYVMRKVTTTLHGKANTTLRSGGSDYGLNRGIHKVESYGTVKVAQAIRHNAWSAFSGAWDGDYPFTSREGMFNIGSGVTTAIGDHDQDDAASPTQDIPGELVYQTGSNTPTQDDYKAQNSW